MNLLTGDLGPTANYTRREYRALVGLTFKDGRDVTVWLEHWTAKARSGTKTKLSRYGVAEVRDVGFRGRAFVWHKDFGEEYTRSDRKPPYTVRVKDSGEVTCQCMADTCDAPCCRHIDATLVLIDEGAFDRDHELQGA